MVAYWPKEPTLIRLVNLYLWSGLLTYFTTLFVVEDPLDLAFGLALSAKTIAFGALSYLELEEGIVPKKRRALTFGFGIFVDFVQSYIAVDKTMNTYT